MASGKLIKKYLENYSESKWNLTSSSTENVNSAVVIPVLAESDYLFSTIESLSENHETFLKNTLIICVVNNKEASSSYAEDIADNQRVLKALEYLSDRGKKRCESGHFPDGQVLEKIEKSPLRVAYVDASSPGREMPEKTGGVGLARKIGFDLALNIFDYDKDDTKIICSLDADTLVDKNYIPAVRYFFEKNNRKAAAVSFAHRYPEEEDERAAICCYEIFLRYYVMGLAYARSPYAFHSIGSAMAFTAEGYASVRGMNKKKAGEDFYFLNKMAKADGMGNIETTMVYPSPRASERVPFGTGKRVERFLNGENEEYVLYEPETFEILRRWLLCISSAKKASEREVMKSAKAIHPDLEKFLEKNGFYKVWPRFIKNSTNDISLRKHINCWFDGFRTLKLIKYLSGESLPPANMFTALERLAKMTGDELPVKVFAGKIPPLEDQEKILDYLKNRNNR